MAALPHGRCQPPQNDAGSTSLSSVKEKRGGAGWRGGVCFLEPTLYFLNPDSEALNFVPGGLTCLT